MKFPNWVKVFLLAIPAALSAGCGGGGGGGSSGGTTAQSYQASGQVSGLDGQLALQYNNQSLSISGNGQFQLPGSFENNADIVLSIQSSPFRQQCVLNNPATRHVSSSNITDINITCSAVGQLTGHVSEYFTGGNIADAKVALTATSNGQQIAVAQTTTDANGSFTVNGIGVSDRFVISVVKAGFGEQAVIYSNSTASPNVTSNISLLPSQLATSFDGAVTKVFQVGGYDVVSLPANALVTPSGTPPSGLVSADITVIDPSSDTSVMPGNYRTLDPATGAERQIESFGALSIKFVDAGGQRLQLANGSTAMISIPLAAGVVVANAPASIPLFYFNDSTGYWVQEGTANLQQVNGSYFYVGQVSHFTVWNADRIYETVFVNGCVIDGAGNPLAFARVSSYGSDYIGSSSVVADIAGQFSVPVRINSSVLISATGSGQSQTQTVLTTNQVTTLPTCLRLAPDTATIKLTWGELPTDLDSHFYGPDGNAGIFHIYFEVPSAQVGSTLIALDVDDVTSFGPEIATIPRFPVPGTYSYYVHNYSGNVEGTIRQSPARVELNLDGVTTVFSPTTATGTDTENWHVFDLVVDSALHATVVPVQQFVPDMPVEPLPPVTAAQSPTMRVTRQSVMRAKNNGISILKPLVEKKYYAN